MGVSMKEDNKKGFTDEELCLDALFSEKHAAKLYNSFVDTCVSGGLQNEVTALLCEEHKLHTEIYTEMKKRGWCDSPKVDQQMIAELKAQFPSA